MTAPDIRTRRAKGGVGQNIEKVDSSKKTTGLARYGSDLYPEDVLHATVVRSNQSHAKIRSVDVSKAAGMEGVVSVVSRDELLGGFDDRVRFYGDVVAAVAAESTELADLARTKVDYDLESLDTVFDPNEAYLPDSPEIHENNPDYGQHGRHEFQVENNEYQKNIDDYHELSIGDVAQGFEAADFVHEDEYVTPRVNPCNLDTHCCIAEWDGDTVIITETIGAPSRSRDEVAELLGLPSNQVQVRMPPTISSSFGARSLPQITLEPVAATLARNTGRPVKLWFDREEEFVASDHRHRTNYRVKLGITEDGKITALEISVVADTGAYPNGVGHIVLSNGQHRPLDLYAIPNYSYEGVSVYTNNLIAGEFRGIGSTQLGYALDSHIDETARLAGLDPVEMRMRNFVSKGYERPHSGVAIESCGIRECVESGWETFSKRRSGATDDPNKVRGWGLGCGTHTTGVGALEVDSAEVPLSLHSDGEISAKLDVLEHGQGTDTVMTQIISQELELPPSEINVERYAGTTDTQDYLGSVGSRSTYITGSAVVEAAKNLKSEVKRRAVARFEASSEDEIGLVNGTIKVGIDEVPWEEVLDEDEETLTVTGRFESTLNPPSYGAHFAEVEVDVDTGKVDLTCYVPAQDVGFAINPKMIEGQLEGGISQGIEFALFSEMRLESGSPINANLADYPVISPKEMPDEIECVIVESMEESGPYGAKGIGTPVMPPIAPAVVNAIRDATGTRFTRVPIAAEEVARSND